MGWSGFIGLGGNAFLAGRPEDRFGVAYFDYGFSSDLKESLATLNIDLGDEQGLEALYAFAVTPNVSISVDGQIIDPGAGSDTDFFVGLRANVVLF